MGAPFVLGGLLAVSQVSPPFAGTTRLKQITPVDGTLSITATGPGGSVDSFVLGRGCDDKASPRSILIGTLNVASTSATDTGIILIGSNIATGNSNKDGVIAIGDNVILASGTFVSIGSSITIGAGATQSAGVSHSGAVCIGSPATVTGASCVAIGSLVTATDNSVAIGQNIGAGLAGVAIGGTCAADAVTVGEFVTVSGVSSVIVGRSGSSAAQCITIGRLASTSGFADSIAIGYNTTTLAIGDCFIGGDPTTSHYTIRFLIGPPLLTTYPGLTWINTGSTAGVDTVAPHMTIVGGLSTGTGAGGELRFQTGAILASSATRQTATERLAIIPSVGGAANAILRFSNYTSGAAANTLAITNAPAARQPISYIPVTTPAGQGWIPVF